MSTSIAISILSLFTSVLGFFAQLVIAWQFGAGEEVDAYFTAFSVPLLIGGLGNAAVAYRAIPIMLKRGTLDNTSHYEGTLLTCTIIGSLVCATAGALFSFCSLPHYANAEVLRTHSGMTLASFAWMGMVAGLVGSVASAICQLRGQYLLPALVNCLGPLSGVVAWILNCHSISGFAFAVLVGQILATLTLGCYLWRKARVHLGMRCWRQVLADLKELPLIATSVLVFIAYGAVDSVLAARLGDGAVTLLAYAQRLTIAICGFVVSGVGVVALPRFSLSHIRGDAGAFSLDVIKTVRGVFFCTGLISITTSALAPLLLRLLFQAGRFSAESTAELSLFLPFMLAGGVFMSCTTIVFRAHYSMNNIKWVAGSAVVGLVLYIVISLVGLCSGFGLYSFGAAYVVSWAAVLCLSLIPLVKMWGAQDRSVFFSGKWGVLISFIICGLLALWVRNLGLNLMPIDSTSAVFVLLTGSIAFGTIYVGCLTLAGVPEGVALQRIFQERLRSVKTQIGILKL